MHKNIMMDVWARIQSIGSYIYIMLSYSAQRNALMNMQYIAWHVHSVVFFYVVVT